MTESSPSRISRGSFGAGAAATFAGIAVLRGAARAAGITFKVSYPVPATHPQHIRMTEAAARIATASGGRLTLQLFPNGELGGDDASVSQLRSGAIQMYVGSSGVL